MSHLWASLRRALGRWAGAADAQPSEGTLLPPAALPADMDEEAWLACTNPQTMLAFLRGRPADRKLLLFTVADCRLFAGTLPREGGLALEVAERHADGLATAAEVKAARAVAARESRALLSLLQGSMRSLSGTGAVWDPQAWATAGVALHRLVMALDLGGALGGRSELARTRLPSSGVVVWLENPEEEAERMVRIALVRCLFGNPFRPAPALDQAVLRWEGGTVVNLARQAYDERQLPSGTLDPQHLLVLADALEEAGCTDPDVLRHLHGPGPHVRGCWALDIILAKDR